MYQPSPIQRAAVLMLLMCSLGSALSAAADDKSGATKALRRAQMEAAKAQQEKAEVEAEKAELAGKLEKSQAEAKKTESASKGQLAGLHRALTEAKAHAEALQAQDDAHVAQAREALGETVKQANERFDHYEADITALRQRLAEADAHGRQLEHQVQLLEGDKARLSGELGERGETLASCEKKNGELFQLNAELRKQYQDKGLLSLLRSGEPLTGLARVKEQNAMQDIEDKAYDARIAPGAH